MSSERGISPSAVALAFLLGGALGAFVGLIYAPDSGKRTRVRLRQFAEEAQEKTEDTVREFRDKAEGRVREWRDRVEEVVSTGKELLEENKDLLTGAYEAGKEAFLRERRKLSGGDAEPTSAQ
ncbi:MAG: YtxH domain-containing protein [candidate division NC10 bacterium]|nr:YtxH domain-containing protein [candidate division NC10 bacterium]